LEDPSASLSTCFPIRETSQEQRSISQSEALRTGGRGRNRRTLESPEAFNSTPPDHQLLKLSVLVRFSRETEPIGVCRVCTCDYVYTCVWCVYVVVCVWRMCRKGIERGREVDSF
jgi:hypothetical protein